MGGREAWDSFWKRSCGCREVESGLEMGWKRQNDDNKVSYQAKKWYQLNQDQRMGCKSGF